MWIMDHEAGMGSNTLAWGTPEESKAFGVDPGGVA